ncbi:MAG TPA: type II toxin-antitoxin system RelE/ParE family toxin [Candidatus Brocadiia bacterium]
MERIVQYPEAWFPLSKRTRRCRTNRFPYGVIYQVRGETILVVAIMHLSREPQTWKSRLKNEER